MQSCSPATPIAAASESEYGMPDEAARTSACKYSSNARPVRKLHRRALLARRRPGAPNTAGRGNSDTHKPRSRKQRPARHRSRRSRPNHRVQQPLAKQLRQAAHAEGVRHAAVRKALLARGQIHPAAVQVPRARAFRAVRSSADTAARPRAFPNGTSQGQHWSPSAFGLKR